MAYIVKGNTLLNIGNKLSSKVVVVFLATLFKYHLINLSARWETVKVVIAIADTFQTWKA